MVAKRNDRRLSILDSKDRAMTVTLNCEIASVGIGNMSKSQKNRQATGDLSLYALVAGRL